MTERRKERYIACFLALAALLLALLRANLEAGSVRTAAPEVLDAIRWNIRAPRLLSAALFGGALAVSGFLLQTFFGNPIAGPFVLGISSGAKLAVALTMVAAAAQKAAPGSLSLMGAAFLGAMLSMTAILLVSSRLRSMALLIVCGVMIGYICSAATDIIATFASDSNIVNLHNWSMGSFSGMDWDGVAAGAAVVFPALFCALLLSKPMGAYQLGESYARSVGVDIRRFRAALILLSSVLSACVTAFAGPISFVGIAVPHLMKTLFRTAKPIVMIPACFLGGGVFCLFCDLVARTLFAPAELSISSVTAVFGVPVVLWMLLRRQKRKEAEG